MAKGTDKNRKHRHSIMNTTKAGKKSNPQPPKPVEAAKVRPTVGNISSALSQFHAIGITIESGWQDEIIIHAKVAPGTGKAAQKALARLIEGKVRLITT